MVKKLSIFFISLEFAFLSFDAPRVFSWNQWNCYSWPQNEMTMYIGALGNQTVGGVPWKTIAITSIENWFNSCNPDANFNWLYSDSSCSADSFEGKSCTGYGELGSCFGSSTLGVTKITVSGCNIVEADVQVNSQCIDSGWFNYSRALGVMSHEYGHVVGLTHAGTDALMYDFHQDGISVPQTDDCNGFYQIYYSAALPSKTTNPSPGNGATAVSTSTAIGWSNGGGATSYDVYFGTDPTPDSGEHMGNQVSTSYFPGTLAYSTTYYWQIDANNAEGTTEGDVWSFTTRNAPAFVPLPWILLLLLGE